MAEKIVPAKLAAEGYRWATDAEKTSRERLSSVTAALEAIAKQRAALDVEEERLIALRDHLPSAQVAKALTFLEHADGWLCK